MLHAAVALHPSRQSASQLPPSLSSVQDADRPINCESCAPRHKSDDPRAGQHAPVRPVSVSLAAKHCPFDRRHSPKVHRRRCPIARRIAAMHSPTPTGPLPNHVHSNLRPHPQSLWCEHPPTRSLGRRPIFSDSPTSDPLRTANVVLLYAALLTEDLRCSATPARTAGASVMRKNR